MCAICGFFTKRRITEENLSEMTNSMQHRGPDDAGVVLFESKDGYMVGLGHRRLSIIDLSAAGHQPMQTPDGSVTVVFNGEIYNFKELRGELCDVYQFKTATDTEVILAGYLKWGIHVVEHIKGMFAIAIFDRNTNELVLIRDRIGKKPLYYWIDTDGIVFASELKALMLCPGFTKRINEKILSRYIFQQYICAPETVFQNVFKLEQGSLIVFKNGAYDKRKYWDVNAIYNECTRHLCNKRGGGAASLADDYDRIKSDLKELLKTSVKKRLVADVPLGIMLSGGYDSSLVAAIAKEVSGGEAIRTFSIGFNESAYDESRFSKAISDHIGTEHYMEICTPTDMLELMEDIPKYFDEPFADPSMIPTMALTKLVKKNVTVALSGDGGDELFCGYNVYDRVLAAQKLDKLGCLAHWIGRIAGLEERYPFAVRVISQNRNKSFKTQFFSDTYLTAAENMLLTRDGIPVKYDMEDNRIRDWQIRRMILDMQTYLPEDILTKVDRAAMKYSLECRCPILDTDVIEYSFSIPHKYKYDKGRKKAILKDIAHDYIPEQLLDRKKKGFGIPLDEWMRGILSEKLLDYSEIHFLRKQNLFAPEFTSSMIRNYLKHGDSGKGGNYSRLIWSFLVFQEWHQRYMV